MHQSTPFCRAALQSKGWAPRPLPAAKVPLPDAAMQPLPWGDPSVRFSSAPVIDDESATEELQAVSASATADSQGTGADVVQQEEQVCAAHAQYKHTQMLVIAQ